VAVALGLGVDAMKRWSKLLGIPPTIPAHANNKWSPEDKDRLLEAYKAHWRKKRNVSRQPKSTQSRARGRK
jgi:hypothetical protein